MAEGNRTSRMHCEDSMGRPRLILEKEKIELLLNYNFKLTEVANILDVSVSTVKRRKMEYGLDITYDMVMDEELDIIVSEYKQRTTEAVGIGMVDGYIRSLGIRMLRPRERIQECLQRIDGEYSQRRWHRTISRRVYSVPGPGSIWHIDGWHKLIRWSIVIHGGIDGFSRLVTMLKASTNNKAETVLQLFNDAVQEVHWPSRIRTDYGGENNLVGEVMINKRGEGRGTWLKGSSVHNQRIERFWRDMRMYCGNFFIEMFRQFEQDRLLDINNMQHKFALQAVFVPMINESLKEYKEVWNNHGLRTEKYQTPRQLFVQGILKIYNTDHTVIKDIVDNIEVAQETDFGIEPNINNVASENDDGRAGGIVEVPRIDLEIAEEEKQILLQKIKENTLLKANPRDKFVTAKETVATFLSSRGN